MDADENMGGGGFKKFKKRERKNRIKTPSDKPEDDENHKVESAISITDIINQAHQTPSRSILENDNLGGNKEDRGDEGVKADANAEEVNEGDKAGEENAEEVNASEGAGPNDSMDVNELTTTLDIPEGKGKAGPTPRKAPRFKQRKSKEFKSKPPKRGVLGFGDEIPGMDGLGTDITVICPWEAFSHLELHELSQFGII
ncbi:uncharacterized protein LOC143924947 [Lithobates pipiens]